MKRKAVADKVRDFATDLAEALEGVLGDHVDTLLSRAHGYAVESIQRDIAQRDASETDEDEAPEPEVTPSDRRASRRVTVNERPAKTAGPGRGKAPCSLCGLPGHNKRTCGREPKGSKKTEPATNRRDVIAKRAGALPTPSFSADLGGE